MRFRAGVNFLYNDCKITYPRSIRGSYSFSSLANFLSGCLQQRRLYADLWQFGRFADQSEHRLLRAGRVEN